MKKRILRGVALAAMAGLAFTVRAQDNSDQSQYPTILQQPVDQCLPVGADATFSVVASNMDSYQWYFNNTALDGQTNSSVTIASVGTNDVGYYSASVIKGSEAVPTRLACLNVYMSAGATTTSTGGSGKTKSMSTMMSTDLGSGGPIIVFGAPVYSSGGSGSCPGKYSGYVNYTKTVSQGWGWSPVSGTAHTAADGNRSDTKVQALGAYGDNFCNSNTVSFQDPTMSPVYRFTIYFPQGTQVPTNAYPITLNGFNP